MSDEEKRLKLADALRGKYWSLHANQGDAYHQWDSVPSGEHDLWLSMADRALLMFERLEIGKQAA